MQIKNMRKAYHLIFMYNIYIYIYIYIYNIYIYTYVSNNFLLIMFLFWAIDTIITGFQICTEILPSAIALTSQAWLALIDPQAIFPGTD